MSNVIKPKRGSTVPTSSNLEKGEIGINTSNQSLYYGTGDGVQQIKSENVTGVVGIEHGGTGSSTRNGALRALINGGKNFTGDLNTLTDTGVYWINLSNCTNGPASSGYGTMEVISYEIILQRFTSYRDGNVYCRTYTNSQWYEWREIFGTKSTVPISSGGTGNTTRDLALTALSAGGSGETDANIVASGTYVLTTETASNLPSETGYYLLTVFRYDTSDLACGQLALNLGSNTLYYRVYVTGIWKEWSHPLTNHSTIPIANGGTGATTAAGALAALGAMSERSNGIELGQNLNSSSNFGGYIDFHFNGDTSDYTTRIIEAQSGRLDVSGNFDVKGWLQCQSGFYISGSGGFYVNAATYGNSLPAAGYAGRVFFKKV